MLFIWSARSFGEVCECLSPLLFPFSVGSLFFFFPRLLCVSSFVTTRADCWRAIFFLCFVFFDRVMGAGLDVFLDAWPACLNEHSCDTFGNDRVGKDNNGSSQTYGRNPVVHDKNSATGIFVVNSWSAVVCFQSERLSRASKYSVWTHVYFFFADMNKKERRALMWPQVLWAVGNTLQGRNVGIKLIKLMQVELDTRKKKSI